VMFGFFITSKSALPWAASHLAEGWIYVCRLFKNNFAVFLCVIFVSADICYCYDCSSVCSTVARFSRYAKRGPRVPVQSAPSADATSRPQPTTSDKRPVDLCPYTVSYDASQTKPA